MEIKKIEHKAKRNTAFRTRRKELFKMAREFGQDFGAHVAVVTIHEAGNVFAFGHPNLTSVVQNYKEAKEVELSKKDDDDNQEVVQEIQNLSPNDFAETKESIDDDEDESNSDGQIKVKKGKSLFWKRDDDHQEVQYMLGDQRNKSDQMDFSLPLRHNKVEKNESCGMMIRNKSESGKSLAFDLPQGGSQKNDANQEEQDLRKEVKKQGLSTVDSNMIWSLLRKLLRKLHRVEDLELHELEQLMAEMEEIEKKILDRANQIMRSSVDPSGDSRKDSGI